MTVIMVMAAIMVPALRRAREQGRRSVCRNNIHQFIVGVHLYANDCDGRLPRGADDAGGGSTPVLSSQTHAALVRVIGGYRSLVCPCLDKPFNDPGGWLPDPASYVIGYNYLGGHRDTPWAAVAPADAEWRSPQSSLDAPGLALITELNDWSIGYGRAFAPHTPRGAIDTRPDPNATGIPPAYLGASGGNKGLLDGSVSWTNLADMKVYICTYKGDDQACLATW